MATPARVLLVASTRAYHSGDFIAAAARLGVDVALASDRCHVLAEQWPEGALALDFRDPVAAAAAIVAHARAQPLDGVVATDEVTAVIAAAAAAPLGLRHNPVSATRTAGNKRATREALAAAGARQPATQLVAIAAPPDESARVCAHLGFPVVVKPLHLSASRGVMRADDAAALAACLGRLAAILADPEVRARDPEAATLALVESFVPGPEVAFEGILDRGALVPLALFDKPDPLDGPFFAETLYVTPSRHPAPLQAAITAAVAEAAAAIGLREGPVHAELRLGWERPVVIELAARSIGGLCGRSLRFAVSGAGVTLEELVIAHAIGRGVRASITREGAASGVLMLPAPRPGVLRAVRGADTAAALAGVTEVVISARVGDHIEPLPEGHAYMGFVFARADSPAAVEATLRRAHAAIVLDVAPLLS